jgi:predicted sulfurtransferase
VLLVELLHGSYKQKTKNRETSNKQQAPSNNEQIILNIKYYETTQTFSTVYNSDGTDNCSCSLRIKQNHINFQQISCLNEAKTRTQYVAPETVADMIVKKDPTFRLIDVRSQDDFEKFSLPGAINVPIVSDLSIG